jgi:hypothetical protein
MTDAKTVADAYIAAWNETDAAARKALIADTWTRDATYVDPLMNGSGHDGIAGLIAGVHARFPDFRFALISRPDMHGEHLRFSWGLGPKDAEPVIEGTDYVVVQDDRIAAVTGFLDKVPAH